MPTQPLRHVSLCFTVLLVAIVFWMTLPSAAQAQVAKPLIVRANLQQLRGPKAGTSTFRLSLEGRRFGTDLKKVSVTLDPAAGIVGQATVKRISADGHVLRAEFVASQGYELQKVKVKVGEQVSEDFDYEQMIQKQVKLQAEEEKESPPEFSLQKKYIRVYQSLLDPKVVSDTFGKRLAKRFIVIQVTIGNRSRDYQYLIHDISVEFPEGTINNNRSFDLSSSELSMLRGVAERGQSMGLRNLTIRILRGIGSTAAAISGITAFHDFYSPSVAAFNGPTINAMTDIFPDFTINQMNRLNDSAYASNSVVPKQQARVVAIFIPVRLYLTQDEQDKFWDEPTALWGQLELRDLEIRVDGDFITEVSQVPAVVTTVVVEESERKKLQAEKPEVRGVIVGQFLLESELQLAGPVPDKMTIESTGTPTDTRIEFVLKAEHPVPPDTTVQIELKKKDNITTRSSLNLRYTAEPLSLDAPAQAIELKQGQRDVECTLTGKNFIPGVTEVHVSGKGVTASKPTVESPTQLKVKLSADAAAAEGDRDLHVFNSSGGAPSQAIAIKVKK